MNNFDWNQFEEVTDDSDFVQENIKLPIGVPPMKTQEMFDWEQFPEEPESNEKVEEESNLKSNIRYGLQIPSGIAQAFTWPLGLIKNAASAYAYDEMRKMELEGDDKIDPNSYMKAVEDVTSYFPDQENAEKFLEEHGVPIEAKTTGQKLLKLGSTAATLNPGGALNRLGAGITAPVVSGSLRAAGANETVSDLAGLLAYPGIGAGVNYAKSKLPSNKAKSLTSSIIDSDGAPPGEGSLPRSSYETAEKHLQNLSSIESQELAAEQASKQKFPFPFNTKIQSQNPLSKSRVNELGKDLGLRPSSLNKVKSISEDVGNIISPQKFYNTTEGGKGIMNEVREIDQMAYRKVNDLYKISKEANRGIENIHPKLVNEIDDRLSELLKIPQPSSPQAKMISSLKKLKKHLVEVDEEGFVTGYKPISNQSLIDQTQSFRQIIDFDFAHGDANNIFKPLIKDIENSVTGSAEASGNQAAIESWQDAKNGYRVWSETFNNDYIRPLRNTTNKDFSSQYKKLLDLDEVNVLRNVLNQTEKGKLLERGITREVVEKHLGKYLENPKNTNINEFNKSLRELEAILTKDEVNSIRNTFNEHRKSANIKAKHVITNAEKSMSKYIGKDPEYIQSKFETRTGIREMKNASKTDEAKRTFHTLARQKMRSILQEGNIEKNFKGDDLYKVLNNEKNAEIFRELIGEEATEAARLTAKEIGKNQMNIDKIKEGSKKALAIKFLSKILPLII